MEELLENILNSKKAQEKEIQVLQYVIDVISLYSGLKPNRSKWEVTSTRALTGLSLAHCSIDFVDLTKKTEKLKYSFFL